MRNLCLKIVVGVGILALPVIASAFPPADKPIIKIVTKKDIERTRKTVRMLDDVYKTAVVLITEHYVQTEDDLPAGAAAKALFDAIKKKGWHEVRLLDASGEPYNDANVAQDDFEKKAIKALKGGESYVDKVETREGGPYLRAVTPIPVVSQKCIKCHANYADAKEGEPIGVLSYIVPID